MRKIVLSIAISCLILTTCCPAIVSSSIKNGEEYVEEYKVDTFVSYEVEIASPVEGNFYAIGAQFFRLPFNWTVIFGPITIRADVSGMNGFAVKFYIDEVLQTTDEIYPYEYAWWATSFGRHTIKVELYSEDILRDNDTIQVFKIL